MIEKVIKPMQIFDFTGHKCPLPVLKTKRALKNHSNGEVIEIIADAPAANLDMKHFCEVSGNILLQVIKMATKSKKNKFAKELFTKKYKPRVIKPKKGKGSFKRIKK